jgi:hypothetical protein
MQATTRQIRVWMAALLAIAALGCNSLLGNDSWTLDDGGAADGAGPLDAPFLRDGGGGGRDSTAPPDSEVGFNDSSVEGVDTSPPPPFDSGQVVDTGPVDTGLNPGLLIPPSSGAQCMPSQGDSDCPQGETCRISSVNLGNCDTFTQGHEGTWPCTVDSDCDDTLQCYNQECKVLCPLGMNCAGGCECLDVGNETTGICCPGS